jgi:hypothetical protein
MSNDEPRDDEGRLSRALHERAGHGAGGTPIELDDVRRTARGIRRRRTTLAAAAAAVVVVIAVPVAVAATDLTRADGPVAPVASPTPSVDDVTAAPSPTATAPADPSPSSAATAGASASAGTGAGIRRLTAQGVGRGHEPRIGYLEGATLHHDGTTTRLPGKYLDVTSYHGGWLASGPARTGTDVVTIAADGTVADTVPGAPELVLSADGTEVSWATGETTSTVHQAIVSGMSDSVGDQQVAGSAYPVGFVGPGRVAYVTRTSKPQVRVTDFAGHNQVVDGLISAGGTYQPDGLISGMVTATADGSCWVVRSLDDAKDLWRTCDFSLGAFSPDGRHVIGYSDYRDGLGDGDVAILDARTGQVVQQWQRDSTQNAFAHQVVWEDDGNLLASWFEKGRWSVLRLSVDGSTSTALGPQAATDQQPPWLFTVRP